MMQALVRFLVISACATPFPAAAERSAWSAAEQSQLRLLLAPEKDGAVPGGIEIVMAPGWHTYWRYPGEAGMPPVFDFAGSTNVAKVDVLYPAPQRYDDGTSVSLVYKDEVVFPIAVTPERPGEPVSLRLKARFGVCSEVCIPAEAEAALAQESPAPADPLAEARLATFAARVPTPPLAGRLDIESAAVEGDHLAIAVRMPDSAYMDLFAEPPARWFTGQPTLASRAGGVSHYRLSLAGRPRDAPVSGQRFGFVAVAGGEAVEEAVEIP